MVTELIPYHQYSIVLTPIEATFILTGVVIDTNRFRNRTGSRTFEVAALLKQYGADSAQCDSFLKDTFQDFQQKAQILKNIKNYPKGIVIATTDEQMITNRSIISQVADNLLAIQGVEASFVVARISEKTVGVSARSNGNINVHVIIEKMHGNGHFTAAALQRENTTVEAVSNEMKTVIESWLDSEGQL
jgi:c-di-AMP phosphodiesterase-like protein